MELFIMDLVLQHPTLSSVLVVIAVLRSIFKPLHALIDAYVGATSSDQDDQDWQKAQQSKAYKMLAWFVDYAASIKLPGHK